ncbi:MAG: DNA-processing protein DprA, partial [Gammaproteobacteria bacterium]
TREASREGLDAAARISEGLVRAGFTIISGMAAGIDTAAHEAALIVGGRTVAVMGTGLDHRYPPENSGLANRIVESGGALLSQFLPHQPPAKWTFGLRNATMSGLALATVVVEATGMSGAKMQARLALQHGRPVFLLTSLVSAESWAREYVQEGRYGATAIPVETAGEIVERMDVLNPPELVLTV